MYLTKKQEAILFGLIFGDGYLQPTGLSNARLRIEHSAKQKEYVDWIYDNLKDLVGSSPKFLERIHPISKAKYQYYRLQGNSSPLLGKLRNQFYDNNTKVVPQNLARYLKSPLTLAVWYMDDGYYYNRDRMSFIYLPKYSQSDLARLTQHLYSGFKLSARWHCSTSKRSCHLSFSVTDTVKLKMIVDQYIIPSMRYKLPLTP